MAGTVSLEGFGVGTALNVKVIGGVSQPSSPAKNTIWVNTDVAIKSWQFSGSEPAEPIESMVWIATAKSGSVSINALKKNAILLCPLYVKQYVSGEWVSKEVHVYTDGNWTNLFNGLIYADGAFYTEHTEHKTPDAASITVNDTCIELATVEKAISEVYKVFGPVPLDDINTLSMTSVFTDNIYSTHARALYVAATPNVGRADAAAIEESVITANWATEATLMLDVSALKGEHYVYAGINSNGEAWEYARKLSISEVTGVDTAAAAVSLSVLDEAYQEGVNSV